VNAKKGLSCTSGARFPVLQWKQAGKSKEVLLGVSLCCLSLCSKVMNDRWLGDKSGDRKGKSSNSRFLKREIKSAWRKRRVGMFGNPGSWVLAC
jgi:hypothetical protein